MNKHTQNLYNKIHNEKINKKNEIFNRKFNENIFNLLHFHAIHTMVAYIYIPIIDRQPNDKRNLVYNIDGNLNSEMPRN